VDDVIFPASEPDPPKTAYDVIFYYSCGMLSREEMLGLLTLWPYAPQKPPNLDEWKPAPVFPPHDSFEASVGRGYDEGLLSAADYDLILDALADDTPGER
jgi:hypothetical protein